MSASATMVDTEQIMQQTGHSVSDISSCRCGSTNFARSDMTKDTAEFENSRVWKTSRHNKTRTMHRQINSVYCIILYLLIICCSRGLSAVIRNPEGKLN